MGNLEGMKRKGRGEGGGREGSRHELGQGMLRHTVLFDCNFYGSYASREKRAFLSKSEKGG